MKHANRLLTIVMLAMLITAHVFGAPSPANEPAGIDDATSNKNNSHVDDQTGKDSNEKTDNGASKQPESKISITEGTVNVEDRSIPYRAETGTVLLKDDDGKAKADVFFVAYRRSDVKELRERPITFCFNGGPGSSSVWLHLGCLGPQRVEMPDDASFVQPPGKLIENIYSLLDVTDLVFIDPVSTGFSRPAKGQEKKQFHGYEEDLKWVGKFIHHYTTANNRWKSPKFLCGESYGTLRAAGLAGHLRERYYMELNGIVLVSSVLDFQTLRFSDNNELPSALFLPTYAATAWYHQQLPQDLQKLSLDELVGEVQTFAIQTYLPALIRGAGLPARERRQLIRQLARYTGLTPGSIERTNLKIDMKSFAIGVMQKQKQTVGRFDSRYVADNRADVGDKFDFDPSAAAVFGPYTSAMYSYLRDSLGVQRNDVYEILTGKVQPWSYRKFENRYVSSAETLRDAMTRNPHLHVFIANGYYDLATPFLATEYTFNTLGLSKGSRKRVTMEYYEAGHMMYVHEPSLKKMREDLLRFYASAVEPPAN